MHTQNIAGNIMPKAQSCDPYLLRAATDVLAGERCGFACRRMVINYAAKRKCETKAWWHDGVPSAVTYDWQEFQAATAESTDAGFTIYYNEFRNYRTADPSIPTGKWILHSRFRGTQILEENINT